MQTITAEKEKVMGMREILFRGKQEFNEWSEGSLIIWEDGSCAIEPGSLTEPMTSVDPETVGQFTGLTDKNGKKIFEGDVLPIEDEIVAVVIFKDGCFRMEEYGLCGAWTESGFDECGGGWGIIECEPIDWYTVGDMEIIGNIHDNPELIGGKENA